MVGGVVEFPQEGVYQACGYFFISLWCICMYYIIHPCPGALLIINCGSKIFIQWTLFLSDVEKDYLN